jgi:iron complex outermembrane receptor protein
VTSVEKGRVAARDGRRFCELIAITNVTRILTQLRVPWPDSVGKVSIQTRPGSGRRETNMKKLVYVALAATLASCVAHGVQVLADGSASSQASAPASGGQDLLSLDLNDLMNIKVTTASKKAESFNKIPAAMYVVTSEDIRRSGAQTIPEALRLVPGVEVAQLNSGQYAVSIRGFSGLLSDKLLALIDGRTIYNDLFGGVNWENQQIPMDQIDRIEVIRGPGTAIWGANAVQGIINIITKSAKDTQGVEASATYGDNFDKDLESVRDGGTFGKDGYYRIYGLASDRTGGIDSVSSKSTDNAIDRKAGFRIDQGDEDSGKLEVTGDLYKNVNDSYSAYPLIVSPYEAVTTTHSPDTGGSLLGHWEKLQTNGSTLALQADMSDILHYIEPLVKASDDNINVGFQDSLRTEGAQSVIFGLGYESEATDITSLTGTTVDNPAKKDKETWSGYAQDQIEFAKALSAQIGTKLEHNSFTGWEYEPSAHLGYTPDDQHTLWASASRAVRIPTLEDLYTNTIYGVEPPSAETEGLPVEAVVTGNTNIQSEIVAAYEAGYRVQATKDVLVDLSSFYNQYSQLTGTIQGTATPVLTGTPYLLQPITFENVGAGHTYGGEAMAHVHVTPDWRVNLGYSYLFGDITAGLAEPLDAAHVQCEAQSYLDLTKKIEWDASAYFVGANKDENAGSYTKLDTRLGYHATKSFELSVGGDNLLRNETYQFGTAYPAATYQVPRVFYGQVTWKN